MKPGAGAGDHAAGGEGGSEFDVRARGERGFGCGGQRARTDFVFAESLRRRAGDENRDGRRSDAAEVHGFLSQDAERNHDVSSGMKTVCTLAGLRVGRLKREAWLPIPRLRSGQVVARDTNAYRKCREILRRDAPQDRFPSSGIWLTITGPPPPCFS